MVNKSLHNLWKKMGLRFQSHPWHGVSIGENAPDIVTAFIEITPADTVKYEIDKPTGFLKVDRPQQFSNVLPTLYGFVPQTYCMELVGQFCAEKTGRTDIIGDGDPLDICVLTEKNITNGNILLQAIPIGGLRLVDGGEADDKIVAVLKGDSIYGKWQDIGDVPESVLNRLKHYFLTYKQLPNEPKKCEITHIYDKAEAQAVIRASQQDYAQHFGSLESTLFNDFVSMLRKSGE